MHGLRQVLEDLEVVQNRVIDHQRGKRMDPIAGISLLVGVLLKLTSAVVELDRRLSNAGH